jgi:hypothetical protein
MYVNASDDAMTRLWKMMVRREVIINEVWAVSRCIYTLAISTSLQFYITCWFRMSSRLSFRACNASRNTTGLMELSTLGVIHSETILEICLVLHLTSPQYIVHSVTVTIT